MKYKMAIAVLTITLISALVIGCGNRIYSSTEASAADHSVNQEISSDRPAGEATTIYSIDGEFSNIDILAEVADITVQKGTETQAEVHISNHYRFEYEINNDTLYLTEKRDGPFWTHFINFNNISDSSIVVTLTEKQWESFKAESDIGNVYIEDQTADNCMINSSTGKIELNNCQSDTVILTNDTGDIYLNHISANVQSETDTGKISICDSDLTDLKAESDTGAIKITQTKANNIDLKTDTGKIDVEVGGGKFETNE